MAVVADRRGDAAIASARTRDRRRNRRRRIPLLPALLFTIVATQIPFLLTIYYSLQSYNLYDPFARHFAGLHNYTLIFTDPIFRTALVNTVILTLVPVLLSLLLGLDRKSTRLNSSHPSISYAVFCLKKKNIKYLHNIKVYTPKHLFSS